MSQYYRRTISQTNIYNFTLVKHVSNMAKARICSVTTKGHWPYTPKAVLYHREGCKPYMRHCSPDSRSKIQ